MRAIWGQHMIIFLTKDNTSSKKRANQPANVVKSQFIIKQLSKTQNFFIGDIFTPPNLLIWWFSVKLEIDLKRHKKWTNHDLLTLFINSSRSSAVCLISPLREFWTSLAISFTVSWRNLAYSILAFSLLFSSSYKKWY